jgi:hypothetical protein
MSFPFRLPIFIVVVLLLKLAFRLQPTVQLATVNSAAFEVNPKRSLSDFRRGWTVLSLFFCDFR